MCDDLMLIKTLKKIAIYMSCLPCNFNRNLPSLLLAPISSPIKQAF